MTIRHSLLLVFLPWLFPALLHADDELAELAASKRAAALKLSLDIGGERGSVFGAFISEDGLALVDLGILGMKEEPTIVVADGSPLKLGTILGIFPEPSLALVKFDHRPEVWLRIAPREPRVGEVIALLTLRPHRTDLQNEKVPPAVGPVMARRSVFTAALRETRFRKALSLGCALSRDQRALVSNGCFAIDQGGDLVAFMGAFASGGGQILLTLAPIVEMAGEIDSLVKSGEVIPFPLPQADNPLDLASVDPQHRRMVLAVQQGDGALVRSLFADLLQRYPASAQLRRLTLQSLYADPSGELMREMFEPREFAPGTSTAQQVQHLFGRAQHLYLREDSEGAVSALRASIELSPQDFALDRFLLARILKDMGRLEDAEQVYRKTLAAMPEDISLVEDLESVLVRQGKIKEAIVMTKRIRALHAIYTPR